MTLPSEMASNELSSSPGLPVMNNATSSPTTIAQQKHLMPNINQKFNTSQALIEDPRALQLALELSMANLNTNFNKQLSQVQEESFPLQQLSQQAQMNSSEVFDLNVISAAVAAAAAAAAQQNGNELAANNGILAPIEDRSKKSQNMTECVPVPSSEHVAEIVGRQGCKIKALRAKTNTYIKTPVRNEEPVFVVTGRKEDVAKAKREILSAAEHFSLIRATRKSSLRGVGISSNGNAAGNVGSGNVEAQNGRIAAGPPIFPGQITIYVRVPYRVVGLVVGPKGATIKHIQQETQTYIVTPSREKEPVFEVTGLPENVQTARKQIEAHIALRTGTLQSIEDEAEALKGTSAVENNTNGFGAMHTINSLSQILNENINQEFLDSLYKNGICSSFEYLEGDKKTSADSEMQILKDGIKSANACTNGGGAAQRTLPNCNFVSNMMLTNIDDSAEIESTMQQKQNDTEGLAIQQQQKKQQQQKDVFVGVNNSQTVLNNHVIMASSTHVAATRSCSSASSTTSSKSANNSSGSNSGSGGSTCSSRPELLGFWKNLGDSLESEEVGGSSSIVWQTQATSKGISPTDLLFGARDPIVNESNVAQNEGAGGGITSKNLSAYLLKCVLCNKKDVVGALLPCGHNIFCIECAGVHSCPMCNQNVYQQSTRPSLPLP